MAGGPPALCTNDKESKESSPEAVVYNGNTPSNNNDNNNSNLPANMDGIISSEEVFELSSLTPMDFDWLQDLPGNN